ncbi:hypothetical protein L596_030210 [Steinernema carpocapsae]|uniref:Tyrosine-protein phosphatase domain-containing protein n=1 Tax=Steinernema carpocapsae TaxID=34508 RepID=A0A4U5LS32_STECR|nr:hypothetical protein L596_030210 [Steinernema carpocapsae]
MGPISCAKDASNYTSFEGSVLSIVVLEKNVKNVMNYVICIDNTRVTLRDWNTDYIHANFIRGEPLLNTFICTQGPMMETVKDFWRMVIQENVGHIIMLCETVEQGREKCQQYWPREEGCVIEWPGIIIRNKTLDNTDPTVLTATLELEIGGEKSIIKHSQWRTWPDRSVPQSVLAPFRLLAAVRHKTRSTVVHCSAGVGGLEQLWRWKCACSRFSPRSRISTLSMWSKNSETSRTEETAFCANLGQFRVAFWLKINGLQSMGFRHVLRKTKGMRMHCIQTDLQLVYIYKCLVTFATQHHVVPPEMMPKMQEFDANYQRLLADRTTNEGKQTYEPLTPLKGFKDSAS